MICRLCLFNSEDCFGFFEPFGLSVSASTVVGKYFWFEPKADDKISISLCCSCWKNVQNFHMFYEKVYEAHKSLYPNFFATTLNSSKISLKCEKNSNMDFIKSNSELENSNKEDTTLINSCRNNQSEDNCIKKKKNFEKGEYLHNKFSFILNQSNRDKKISKSLPNSRMNKLIQEDKTIASFMKMKCSVCEVECHSFSSLRWHYVTKHKEKGFAICCNKQFFKRSVLVDHIEMHINPESFKCMLCNKICVSRWTLKLHITRMHENSKAIHECSFCGKSFKLKSVLIRHQLTHIPENEKQFLCTECGKRYPSQGTLLSHIRAYHDRRYAGICDICGKSYNNKEDVRRHLLEVHEGIEKENIKCKVCFKEFNTKYQYNIHKVDEHGDPNQKKGHQCVYCNKKSANSEALKRHIQKVHKAQLKFFCNFCDKVFKTDLSLKEHKATHTGQRLYICPHCPKTFSHNSNMHHHRKRAHPLEFEQARQLKNDKKHSRMKIAPLKN